MQPVTSTSAISPSPHPLDAAAPRTSGPSQRRLHTAADWRAYFEGNRARLLALPWDAPLDLSNDERTAVARSVQQFQLGESSEGTHLRRRAQAYAARTADPAYAEAIDLFIAEEQRHARDLGRFLDRAGLERLQAHWSNGAFRWLRRRLSLEVMLSVLLAAELIAKVYYAALREATGSPLLHRLCDQILRDEAAHVRFHVERLAILRARRRPLLLALTHIGYRLFFEATCAVVWLGHRRVFCRAGMATRDFRQATRREVQRALQQMHPRAYPELR